MVYIKINITKYIYIHAFFPDTAVKQNDDEMMFLCEELISQWEAFPWLVHIYHLHPQIENLFIHLLCSMGSNVTTTMKQALKKKTNKRTWNKPKQINK